MRSALAPAPGNGNKDKVNAFSECRPVGTCILQKICVHIYNVKKWYLTSSHIECMFWKRGDLGEACPSQITKLNELIS